MGDSACLEFSCQNLEFSVNQGEMIQDSFMIYAGSGRAEGDIYSSDTRMQIITQHFCGEEIVVEYCFDGSCMEVGSIVNGYFTVLSNQGEYILNYRIHVQKPILQGSMGNVTNLFHFTNLAKTNWDEAVELFYSPEFINVFRKNERNFISAYLGLSRFPGNAANVEEFFVEINKKAPITYQTDIESFSMEDIVDTTSKTIVITKSGWGYTDLKVSVEGQFLNTSLHRLTVEDFVAGVCHLDFTIDATKLHRGINKGKITICDTRTDIVIPVSVMMNSGTKMHAKEKRLKSLFIELINSYIDMKFRKIEKELWAERAARNIEEFLEIDADNLLIKLYQVQILLMRERFHEAKWYLDQLDQDILKQEDDSIARCYYFYLTTLFNRDEGYVQSVVEGIKTAYANRPEEWRLAWLMLYMEDDYTKNVEERWKLLEEEFERGCSSPILLCEAVLLLQNCPTLLMKLDEHEQNVLWYAAKNKMLKGNIIEQLQYLVVRQDSYSPLLFRTLCEIYRMNKSTQTVATICTMLILGGKIGAEFFEWYELGVLLEVRVTKLYEYYMMSLPLDYTGELPKMVLMYFAYQSNLDYEHNALLYAYIVKNKDKIPDLEQSYRIAMERFVVDQIKLGHINENLAFLYQNILAPQMLRDETIYAFTPLLFMHRIYIENSKIVSVVVIHEKINGESIYPVSNHVCYLPIYGDEYTLLLQDAEGNRFSRSIAYDNQQLMLPEKLLPFIGTYMEGRLSFDIYQSQLDGGYITITPENEKRFKALSESEQVIEEFKKEIRTKLLRYYYENDMIGELDAFLEEIEPGAMEAEERAEFIQFMISRGMLEKAYQWLKCFGLSGVKLKSVARVISRKVVENQFQYEEFLVNVAYYIFEHARYDENILFYLMRNFDGKTTQLRDIWKAASELDMDTENIIYKLLRQMRYTNTFIQEKDVLLFEYSKIPGHDEDLVEECLRDAAYDFFVMDYMTDTAFFGMLYERYRKTGELELDFKLALLKFWAESPKNCKDVMCETIVMFIEELLQQNLYFSFLQSFVNIVPQLHYFVDKTFVEYKSVPGATVRIHYILDGAGGEDPEEYKTEEMLEMYGGIYTTVFSLFRGETIQYYITEELNGEEQVTASDILVGDDLQSISGKGRFFQINDILVSLDLQDATTAWNMLEEYMQQDFCVRELFRVI